MSYVQKIAVSALVLLSLQTMSYFQNALADQLETANSENSIVAIEANLTKTYHIDFSNSKKEKPMEPAYFDDSGSDEFFCCLGEVLLLAALLAVGVLGANLVLDLVRSPERRAQLERERQQQASQN